MMYPCQLKMPPGQRKFQTEFTLVIVVTGDYLLRAKDLEKVPVEVLDDRDNACHLYMITRAPRLSIDPASVKITDSTVSGTVRVHRQDSFEEYSFSNPHQLGPLPLVWTSEWPYDKFAIKNAAGKSVFAGAVAILGSVCQEWPHGVNRQEILYVGQAFGSNGERTAFDRLKSHETLQQILSKQAPDTEVWLTAASIGEIQVIQEIAPTTGRATDSEDTEHVAKVIERLTMAGFEDREAVALAEAGLIRAWQPEYNDRLKHTFPDRKHVALATARDLDIHGLVIQWHSTDPTAEYWAGNKNLSRFDFYGYEVHHDPDRAESLVLQASERPLLSTALHLDDEPLAVTPDMSN